MTLHELDNPQALSGFLSTHPHSLICFSATWCGPCKAAKPQLEALASSYSSDSSINVQCGIIYEHVLGNDIQTYKVRAFPTYVLFSGSSEVGRVQGVNFDGIKELISKHCTQASFGGEGQSLGGGSSSALQSTTTATAEVEKTEAPTEIFRTDYKPLPYKVSNVSMNFDIRDGKTVVESELTVVPNTLDGGKFVLCAYLMHQYLIFK